MKKRKHGKRRNIKFFIALCCIVCFLCGFTFRGSITTAYADSDSDSMETDTEEPAKGGSMESESQSAPSCKYYTSIAVEAGDSLYSIASKYYTEDYESIETYIHEIKKVNGIRSDYICQGSYLTIPYYDKL